ncbi:MAG: hypothetical protein AB1529_07945 [Candidatus Micrarchaeota archaeon]
MSDTITKGALVKLPPVPRYDLAYTGEYMTPRSISAPEGRMAALDELIVGIAAGAPAALEEEAAEKYPFLVEGAKVAAIGRAEALMGFMLDVGKDSGGKWRALGLSSEDKDALVDAYGSLAAATGCLEELAGPKSILSLDERRLGVEAVKGGASAIAADSGSIVRDAADRSAGYEMVRTEPASMTAARIEARKNLMISEVEMFASEAREWDKVAANIKHGLDIVINIAAIPTGMTAVVSGVYLSRSIVETSEAMVTYGAWDYIPESERTMMVINIAADALGVLSDLGSMKLLAAGESAVAKSAGLKALKYGVDTVNMGLLGYGAVSGGLAISHAIESGEGAGTVAFEGLMSAWPFLHMGGARYVARMSPRSRAGKVVHRFTSKVLFGISAEELEHASHARLEEEHLRLKGRLDPEHLGAYKKLESSRGALHGAEGVEAIRMIVEGRSLHEIASHIESLRYYPAPPEHFEITPEVARPKPEAGLAEKLEYERGMTSAEALTYAADAILRPHAAALDDAFTGMPVDYYARKVPLLEKLNPLGIATLKEAPLKDAPRARLIKRLDIPSTGPAGEVAAAAGVRFEAGEHTTTGGHYLAEIMVDGKPKEVIVIISPKPGEGGSWDMAFADALKKADELKSHSLGLFAKEGRGPNFYGFVNVDGNFAVAMDIPPYRTIELKHEKFAESAISKYEAEAGKPPAAPSGHPPSGVSGPPGMRPPEPPGPKLEIGGKHEEFAAGVLEKYSSGTKELGNPEKLADFVRGLLRNEADAEKRLAGLGDTPVAKIIKDMVLDAKGKKRFKTATTVFMKFDLVTIARDYVPKIENEFAAAAAGAEKIAVAVPPKPPEASLKRRIDAIYEKREKGEPLSLEEARLVAEVESLVGKGIRRDAAIAYFEDAALRPHAVPLSSADAGAFKGVGADIYKRKVPLSGSGMTTEGFFEDAPRARLLEAIDLDAGGREMGSSGRVYRAEVIIDGNPKTVAVKIFKDVSKTSKTPIEAVLAEYAAIDSMGKYPGFRDHAPRVYGIVNVDGNIGYAMDYVPGSVVEPKLITAEVLKKHMTPEKLAKVKEFMKTLLDEGYNPGDIEIKITDAESEINGASRPEGHLAIIDLPKRLDDPAKIGDRTKFLKDCYADFEGRVDSVMLGSYLKTKPERLLALAREATREAARTGEAIRRFPDEEGGAVKDFLYLGRERRLELTRKYLEKMKKYLGEVETGEIEAALRKIAGDSGVPVVE